MKISKVTFEEMRSTPGFQELCTAYAAEAGHECFGPWVLNEDTYRVLDEQGLLTVFIATDEDKLVGLCAAIRSTPTHFALARTLIIDAMYAMPGYGANAGLGMLRALKRYANEMRMDGLVVEAKLGTRAHALYERIAQELNTVFWVPCGARGRE